MRQLKETLIFLLFVSFATLLWWGNAADKEWQHSASAVSLDSEEAAPTPTENFTEKKFTVPIEVLDVPDGKTMRVFPSHAHIFLRVRVKDYPDITTEHFRVWCTYPTRSMDALTVHIDIQDDRIHSARLEQEKVEFIIEN